MKSQGHDDHVVEWFKPKSCPQWMREQPSDALPKSIVVREIRRTVGLVSGTLVTTLPDPLAYPAADVVDVRQRRRDVETDIRHLKQTLGLDVLRCKSKAGVRKELAVICLVYNLARVVMALVVNRWRLNRVELLTAALGSDTRSAGLGRLPAVGSRSCLFGSAARRFKVVKRGSRSRHHGRPAAARVGRRVRRAADDSPGGCGQFTA